MSYTNACLHCGRTMECAERGRVRRYCSDRYRQAAHREKADIRDNAPSQNTRSSRRSVWGREFPIAVTALLVEIEGVNAGLADRIAEAVRLAVAEDRRWASLRSAVQGTGQQGRALAALLERRDPRVQQFLEECGV